jgi:hypothetical protein
MSKDAVYIWCYLRPDVLAIFPQARTILEVGCGTGHFTRWFSEQGVQAVRLDISSLLGILLAISAGTLVYVGASHLLPEVEKENKRYSIISLAVGVLVAMFIVMSKR